MVKEVCNIMDKYLKNKVLFFNIVVAFLFSSMPVAGEESQYTLDKQGIFRHKTEDFEVKMLENGNIQIYGEGRRLAKGDAYAGNFPLSFPEVTVDKEKQEYILKRKHDCKDGNTVFCIRKMKVVGGSIELMTILKATGDKPVTHYTPKKSGYAERFWMRGSEYDGSKWKFDDEIGQMVVRERPLSNNTVWKMKCPGVSGYPVKEAAFWQKGRRLGFSLKNSSDNSMALFDKGKADAKNVPQAVYLFKMYPAKERSLPKKKEALQTTLIISPAYQSPGELRIEAIKDNTVIGIPVNEWEEEHSVPVEITILPSEETIGAYTVKLIILDKTESVVFDKITVFHVTENHPGKARFGFISPKSYTLYWLNVDMNDANGNSIINDTYTVFISPGMSSAALNRKMSKGGSNMPQVLIIGDSISIGYTEPVMTILEGKAVVARPKENCQGTTRGMEAIDEWLGSHKWNVIHFNWGLHDLKHVKEDGLNSNDPNDRQQAPIDQYEKNLDILVKRLKKTGAKLIFATTTPYCRSSAINGHNEV